MADDGGGYCTDAVLKANGALRLQNDSHLQENLPPFEHMKRRREIALGFTGMLLLILAGWAVGTYLQAPEPTIEKTRGGGDTSAVVSDRPAAQSKLWLLAVGVSRYQDERLRLDFADTDAKALAQALKGQQGGRVYTEVKTQVLINHHATRERVLHGIQRFLNQAGPQDVAVIFLAGHGVRDSETESYYFLPYAATYDTMRAAGIRMTDFNEELRVLRGNVRRVVVLLDTCHAGALDLGGARGIPTGEDLASQIAASEGLFVLGSSKPGEQSHETKELRHGAFTFALLKGLEGAADGDEDGLISVSDLFAFTARQVPVLTGGRQHPYHDIRGTDLVFAATERRPEAAHLIARPVAPAVPIAMANTIGVAAPRNSRTEDPEHDWIGPALGAAFSTELGKVGSLRVVATQLIDRKLQAGADSLGAAQELGIAKLLDGKFTVVGNRLEVQISILDTATGIQEAADSAGGELGAFFDIEKDIVLKVLSRLPVEVADTTKSRIEEENNTDVDAYRQLLEMEGVVDFPGASKPRAPEAPERTSAVGGGFSRFAEFLSTTAWASEAAPDPDAGVRAFIEEFRRAHEVKDVDQLASLYVTFSDRQRAATQAYLKNTTDLAVEFVDVGIKHDGDQIVVTYIRRDRFLDKSGKSQRLEVQVTKTLVPHHGTWRIAQ